MKKLIILMQVILMSCTKGEIERVNAVSIGFNIKKINVSDSLEILVNHPYKNNIFDTTHFTGFINWGDGNIIAYDEQATGSLNKTHKYNVTGNYNVSISFNKQTAISTFTALFRGDLQSDTIINVSGLSQLTNLYSVVLQDCRLLFFDVTGCLKLTNIWLRGNCLNQSTISNILTYLNGLYPSPASSPLPYVQIDKQLPPAPPDPIGNIAKNSLISKNWIIETD